MRIALPKSIGLTALLAALLLACPTQAEPPPMPIFDAPQETKATTLPPHYLATHAAVAVFVQGKDDEKPIGIKTAEGVSPSLTLGETVSAVVPMGETAEYGTIKKIIHRPTAEGDHYLLMLDSGMRLTLVPKTATRNDGEEIPALYAIFTMADGNKMLWILERPEPATTTETATSP